ncbi:hypothetical protein [[Eubacterium] hominis]|uniref:hypothetical protein n=1 Tax=[Eubacterium] hominis TaxID=2764325 RepID=UPI0023DD6EE6
MKEIGDKMCNLSEGIRKEAKEEGKLEGKLEGKAEERFLSAVEHVKNLMDMLKISEDIRQAVIDEIEKKN